MPWDAVKKIPKSYENWGQGDSFTGKSVKGQAIRELRSPSCEGSMVQEPMWIPSLGTEGWSPSLGRYVASVLSLGGMAILGEYPVSLQRCCRQTRRLPQRLAVSPEGLSAVPLPPRPVSGTLSLGQNCIVIAL